MKERFFKDWIFEKYVIYNEDYLIWVSNGFSFFKDHKSIYYTNTKQLPLLSFCSYWQRRKLWKEYKKEKKLRIKEILK